MITIQLDRVRLPRRSWRDVTYYQLIDLTWYFMFSFSSTRQASSFNLQTEASLMLIVIRCRYSDLRNDVVWYHPYDFRISIYLSLQSQLRTNEWFYVGSRQCNQHRYRTRLLTVVYRDGGSSSSDLPILRGMWWIGFRDVMLFVPHRCDLKNRYSELGWMTRKRSGVDHQHHSYDIRQSTSIHSSYTINNLSAIGDAKRKHTLVRFSTAQ